METQELREFNKFRNAFIDAGRKAVAAGTITPSQFRRIRMRSFFRPQWLQEVEMEAKEALKDEFNTEAIDWSNIDWEQFLIVLERLFALIAKYFLNG
jgi:hypothetical protein